MSLIVNKTNDISQKTNHIKSSWMELICCINFDWFHADTDSPVFLRQQVVPFSKIFIRPFHISQNRKNTSLLHHNKYEITSHNARENHSYCMGIKRSDHGSQNHPILPSNVCSLVFLSQFGIDGLQFLM